MLSKKEMGMIALAGVGVIGIGYFASDALGGAGGARAGQILGSPGALTGALPSSGTSSQKLAAIKGSAIIPKKGKEYVPTDYYVATKSLVSAQPAGLTAKGRQVKAEVAARQARGFVTYAGETAPRPTYTPKAIAKSQTFGKVAVAVGGGGYTPKSIVRDPTTSRVGRVQALVSGRSTAPAKTGGLTAKGAAVKKRVAERKARSG